MLNKNRGDIIIGSNNLDEKIINYPETIWLNQKLEWFQDMKLGFIFHWGLYSQAGIVESWQLSEKDEWAREPKSWRKDINQLKLDYWNLIKDFNPTKFNPDDWMNVLSKAGFKYGIITSKHHDGFNMFNTSFSEYKVCGKQSPCKTDLMGEIISSMRKYDINPGIYYSKADWYHPDYWNDDSSVKGRHVSYNIEEFPEKWSRYVKFVHNQIEELTSNYGKIHLLWLDAGWCGEGSEDLQMDLMAEIARKNQPDLIMVNRAMGGRHENYVTPERKIPNFNEIPKKPWESNVPIGNDWGYVPGDIIKSGDELIRTLVEIVGKGGNVLFGIGPTPEGTLYEEEVRSIQRLGNWMEIFSKGIYSTRPIQNYKYTEGVFCTQNKNIVNMFFSEELCGKNHDLSRLLPDNILCEIKTIKSFSSDYDVTWIEETNELSVEKSKSNFPFYGCQILLNN